MFDSATVLAYKTQLQGLTRAQAEASLTSVGLTKAQRNQVLSALEVTTATKALTAGQIEERIATQLNSVEDAKVITQKLTKAGIISTESGVTTALTVDILEQAVANGTLTAAEMSSIASALGLTVANGTLATSFKILTLTLWNNIKAFGVWLATNPFTWAIAGGLALAGVIDYLTVSYDEANEVLDEANEKYKETESNISSLNDELTTNKEKIEELKKLESDGTITDSQKEELENLENKNAQLETQIALQKELLELQNQDKAEAAKDVANAESHSVAQSVKMGDETGKSTYKGTVGTVTDTEAIKEDLALMDEYESKVSDLETELINAKQAVSNAESPFAKWKAELKVSNIEKEIQKYKDSLTTLYTDLQTRSANAQETLESLKLDPETNADEIKIYETALASMQEQLVEVKDTIEDVQDTANKIDVSLSDLEGVSDKIKTLGSAFKELSNDGYITIKTLSEIQTATGLSGAEWEEYKIKLLNAKAGSSEFNQIMSEMTYKILDNVFAGKDLTAVTEDEIEAILRENGVTNASAVAKQYKAKATLEAKLAEADYTDGIDAVISTLGSECEALGLTEQKVKDLATMYASAQQAMSEAVQSGATSRLGILKSELEGIKGIADAYALLGKAHSLSGGGYDVDGDGVNDYSGEEMDEMSAEHYKKYQADRAKILAYANAVEELNNIKIKDININPDYSGNKSSSKDTKETFDWIETAISRLQRSITNFGKTVSATWKSWTDRNSALKSQISEVTKEIGLQQQAADKYWALAESVSGVGNYKGLIQKGALDISTVRDENTIDAIKKYQEYYENYLSALDAKQDAEDELRNLKQTSADNISTEYDDLVSFIEHEKSMLDSTADILENKGYMISASIYDKLIQYEYDTISTLEEKYKKLNENLNNSGIQQGTKQWNDMKFEILEVEEAILESQNALTDYNNTLRDLDWEVFDKLQEKIEGIISESEFLIKLMSDEKMFDEGKITEHGQATLGLYVLNYKTYLAQAEEYGQKLEEIREDLENDPYNQTLVDQEKEWTEALRDSILASEDALQSIVDLKQEGYDSLLESLDTAIEKYKDLINEQKNAYDYQKQIDNLTGDVTKYQKIMKSLEGMEGTEEGKKLIQEYSVKLKESEEALAEAENEKYLDDLDKLLQTLSDDATEFVSQKMDNVDALVKEVIAQTETNTGSILDTLKTETSNVGTSITQEMESIWGTNGTFTTSLNSVVDMFKQYFENLQKEADEKAKQTIASTPSGGSSGGSMSSTTPATSIPAPSTSSSSSSSSSGWKSALVYSRYLGKKSALNTSTSIVDLLKSHDYSAAWNDRANLFRAMGGSGTYVGSSSQNRFMINTMKAAGFAQGGTIGNLIRATGEDGFVLARKGEGILTPENMKMLENVMVNMNPIVDSLAKLPSLPDVRRQNGDTQITFGDIQMYGVNDPVEFEKQLLHHMKNSRPIRKVMKDTTIGEALGKNPMIRYTR